VEISVVNIK